MPANVRLVVIVVCATLVARAADAQQPSGTPPSGSSYFQFDAPRPPELMAGSPEPHYPEQLRAQRLRGEVVAQFVVDTLGHVVPGTFSVVRSPHPLFSRAVRANLVNLRFRPAEGAGRPVSQIVSRAFHFEPTDARVTDSATATRDDAAAAADSAAAVAADSSPFIASYSFDDENPDADVGYGLSIVRHGTRDVVLLRRIVRAANPATLATLALPGRNGSRLLVIRSCTLDGKPDPEVIGLVAVGPDGHRATDRPSRAWRANRVRARFETLSRARVRCDDEEDVD